MVNSALAGMAVQFVRNVGDALTMSCSLGSMRAAMGPNKWFNLAVVQF